MAKHSQVLLTTWLDHPTADFVEWIAHHRALGVNRIHVFLSDTLTEVPPLAAALESAGLIETSFIAFDRSEASEQIRNAAIHAARIEASETSGWGLFLAPDEYLTLSRHDTLPDMMNALKTVHALSAPVRRFYSKTLERTHTPGAVLGDVSHRGADPVADGTGGREWRSIVKLGLWPDRLPGYPVGKMKTGLSKVRWLNGAGKPMPKPHANRTWQHDDDSFGSELAAIGRVPAPSIETLLLRAAYVKPGKAQAMADDLIAILNEARSKHIKDNALAGAAKARQAEIERILKTPYVAQAYHAQCEEEAARIKVQTKRHGLWNAVLAHLDEVPPVNGAPQVAALPIPPAAPHPDPVAPVKVHPRVPDEFARVATDPPPRWFHEIYPGGDRQGFLIRLEHHALIHIERDPDTLIVTFDNISNVNDISYGRKPWAYDFVRGGGYSHFSVISRRKDWYRDPQIIDELRRRAEQGFFSRYKKVVMAGTSMGGFAAMAFSSLVPGCIVLAYSPQSTLDRELVPWEERFDMGRERNWSLPHSDASFEIQSAKKVYVIYDPFFEPDKLHIERLEGDNVVLLKSWFAGHFSAVFIRRANLIKPLFQMVIDETLTEDAYYRLLRGRRSLAWYRKSLEQRAIETGHDTLAKRVGPAFDHLRRQLRKHAQQEA